MGVVDLNAIFRRAPGDFSFFSGMIHRLRVVCTVFVFRRIHLSRAPLLDCFSLRAGNKGRAPPPKRTATMMMMNDNHRAIVFK